MHGLTIPMMTIARSSALHLLAVQGVRNEGAELGIMSVVIVAAVAVALALAALVAAIRTLRGTTLLAPAVWALGSLVAIVVIQAALLRVPTYRSTREKLDLLAATSTFCPLVALLGAKRPQNRPWPFIVLSLWAVAALPVVESLIIHPGDWMEIHPLWGWFYLILLVAGVANYLPTRYWASALIAAVGQCNLLCDYLPGISFWLPSLRSMVSENILPAVLLNGRRDYRLWGIVAGIVPLAAASCLAYCLSGNRRRGLPSEFASWNGVWLDFRDAYGVVWAMRVIERLNALSLGTGVNFRLTWQGFIPIASHARSSPSTEVEKNLSSDLPTGAESLDVLMHEFRMLLLRFVSNDWIDRRLQKTTSQAMAVGKVFTDTESPYNAGEFRG